MDDDTAQLLALRDQTQGKMESLFPAIVSIPHLGAVDVKCAGGTVRETGAQLQSGGLLVQFDLGFRIRRERLSGMPEIGQRLNFEGQDVRIMRVVSPTNDVAYLLGCDHIGK